MKSIIVLALLLGGCLLQSCTKQSSDPEVFLPIVKSPSGENIDAQKSVVCRGDKIDLGKGFLNPENFNAVFACANYDRSLEPLRPLFTNAEFTNFISNVNVVFQSKEVTDLKTTLQNWLQEGPEGGSRLDRLVPWLANIIKDPVFQDALPLIENVLAAGDKVWDELLPGLADVIYEPRFPDNIENILLLAENSQPASNGAKNYAKTIKNWARFFKTEINGKSNAAAILEMANEIQQISPPGLDKDDYLYRMNLRNVWISYLTESGRMRGEVINPRLNADPDDDEIQLGLSLTPEQRQERIYRRLWKRGADGSAAQLAQLAGLIFEFQKMHPDFLPALASWFSSHGPLINDKIFDYVAETLIRTTLSEISIEPFLKDWATKQNLDLKKLQTGDDFQKFLQTVFAGAEFSSWLETTINERHKEHFGDKNAKILARSNLKPDLLALYTNPAVSAFAKVLIPTNKTATLQKSIEKFSNLYLAERIKFDTQGKNQALEAHVFDAWSKAVKDNLGENFIVTYITTLAQSIVTDYATKFGQNKLSLSQWYFSSAYNNPATFETLLAYAMKELQILPAFYRNKDYIRGQFTDEVFKNEDDRRAFRMLVDQVPNIVFYIRSGMSRSGNDLTRAMASKDSGFFVNNYTAILAKAFEVGCINKPGCDPLTQGWLARGIQIFDSYYDQFGVGSTKVIESDVVYEDRIGKAADALKQVMSSLVNPVGAPNTLDYSTTTLSRLLIPLNSLLSDARRADTTKFVLTTSDELLNTPDEKINNLFASPSLGRDKKDPAVMDRRGPYKSISEILKREKLSAVAHGLNQFFHDKAVRPALKYFTDRTDDGSLQNLITFIRRVLGFKS